MNFNFTDFKIILSMTLFLILISFVMPALGFAANDVNETDIPEFNASKSQYSFINSTPEYPSRPSAGTLVYEQGAESYEDTRQVWLRGDSSDGISITLINPSGPSNPQAEVNLNKFNSTGANTTTELINESEYVLIENYSYIISFENLEYSDANNTITVDWELHQQPEDTSWLGRIPVVGGLVSGASQTAAVVGWIGSIIFQPIYNGMVTATNVFVTIHGVIVFIFDFLYWLLSTYNGVISASPASWVSVFLAIPGVVLSFEFVKLLIILTRTIINAIPLV